MNISLTAVYQWLFSNEKSTRVCLPWVFGFIGKCILVSFCLNISLSTYADETAIQINLGLPKKNVNTQLIQRLKQQLMHYNKKKYIQAFQVFLMNGNVEYAYVVANLAVKKRPDSIFWRKKLVQVALWSNFPKEALQQYIYFIQHNIDAINYQKEALKLAVQLSDYDTQAYILKLQLNNNPNSQALQIALSQALQGQGYPKDALKLLQQISNYQKNNEILKEINHIAQGTDDVLLQLNSAKQIWQANPDKIQSIMTYGEALYLHNQLFAAYKIFQRGEPLPADNTDFWPNYAKLASIIGKTDTLIKAYKYLLYHPSTDHELNAFDTIILINLESFSGLTETAYQDAIYAYSKDHMSNLIPLILSLGQELNKWQELKEFIAQIPLEERIKLEQKPQFYLLLITINGHLGLTIQVHNMWETVMQRWSHVSMVQHSYLWYLLDNNDFIQIQYTLRRWRERLRRRTKSWLVFSAALSSVGDNKTALAIMLQHLTAVNKSYELIIGLSDLLNQDNRNYLSYYLTQKAYHSILKEIQHQPTPLALKQSIKLAQIMQNFASEPFMYQLISQISRDLFKDKEADDQVLNWALKSRRYDLAHYIMAVHKISEQFTQPWMTLTIALLYNDQPTMADLLSHYPNHLPYRDRLMTDCLWLLHDN
ncbi:MAG: tetratricopeptide repeat protein [Rickettsia endosymbiont of Ixodes persulcatus]|nr:tetratricopeptide repeat protein [Rickettsia endosymbiont of Ixodes persulcatus]